MFSEYLLKNVAIHISFWWLFPSILDNLYFQWIAIGFWTGMDNDQIIARKWAVSKSACPRRGLEVITYPTAPWIPGEKNILRVEPVTLAKPDQGYWGHAKLKPIIPQVIHLRHIQDVPGLSLLAWLGSGHVFSCNYPRSVMSLPIQRYQPGIT